jgi:hypothetical protein
MGLMENLKGAGGCRSTTDSPKEEFLKEFYIKVCWRPSPPAPYEK